MKPLTVRWIHESDIRALTDFFERNDREDVTMFFHPFPLTAQTAAALCATTSRKDIYGAAFAGDTIVGLYMLRGWDEGYQVPSFGVIVERALHGRGIGRLLTQTALGDARQRAVARVRLTVSERNSRAIALYASLGFREAERIERGGHQDLVMLNELGT